MRPKKRWGQHFLTRPEIGIRVAEFAAVTPADIVVEIGAGTGILTEELAKKAKKVVAFEIDTDLIPALRKKFSAAPNVEIVVGDFLKVGPECLEKLENFKVVANIPYYLTTPLIFLLLGLIPRMEMMVLTIQREVAERLAAKPDTREYGALTLSVGILARVELVKIIKKGAFRPPPRVESAVVRISPHLKPLLEPAETREFSKLVHSVFGQRRKTILNQLAKYLDISKIQTKSILTGSGIDPLRRPETINLEEYIRLVRNTGEWREGT
ncbi:MAG: 16S rRNA (adenine(1518)-N(6)/adenine(1519)-N(6))-dimethyltransferase RsmA [Candidatus Omnitrophota bacterium]